MDTDFTSCNQLNKHVDLKISMILIIIKHKKLHTIYKLTIKKKQALFKLKSKVAQIIESLLRLTKNFTNFLF